MKKLRIRAWLIAIASILPAVATAEIGSMKVDHYCSFNDEPLPSILTTFDSDNAAEEALRRVMSYTGLPPRFEILAADVPNAAAVIRNNKRYILYNQRFMRKVRDTTRNNWSEISILAHEIGHHLSYHTFGSFGSRPKFELEADRFSGFVLQKMGASLDDAVAVMERMVSEQGSRTHPRRSARVAAVTNGWVDAEEKAGGSHFKREPTTPRIVARNNAPSHSHNGREHRHPLPASGLNHQHGAQQPVVSQPAAPVRPRLAEPEMVAIRGSSFMMGSPNNEAGRDNDEKQHNVNVGSFSIGKYEVTNTEYARCVTTGACKANTVYQGFTGSNQPVVGVSWQDATDYAIWLSRETGRRYRLPTEAEWEFAARAGSQTAYPWGSAIGSKRANCNGCGSQWGGKTTAPVGSFPANNWGLHNVSGNVWEWTCSAYDKGYNRAEQQCAANNDSRDRVLRGGSWLNKPAGVRSAGRDWGIAALRYINTGFRLSRTP